MQEVFRELSIEIPTNESSLMITSEYQEFLKIKAAAHNVGLMVRYRIIWIVCAKYLFITSFFIIKPDM